MLSIYTLKSANQAAHYYEQGDYYIKGDAIENNTWFGKGAKDLGLEGSVDAKKFKKLLEGELPNGVKLGGGYDLSGNQKHRPGYDLTFSACKSASILAIVGGDQRITKAHLSAVKEVLTNIEDRFASTRVKSHGSTNIVKTNNIVAALFNHTDSRLLDPNLHTHCIILNMTKLGDKWRSLYGDDFYNFKMALGLEYRMIFAQKLLKLGYEIDQTSKNGLFEIEGVSKELIQHFSKRRAEIEKIIDNSGRESSDKITVTLHKNTKFERQVNTIVSSMATIYSRAKKVTLRQEDMQQHWTNQLAIGGFDRSEINTLIDKSKNMGEILPDNPAAALLAAIPIALIHLTSRKHEFSEKELIYAIKGLCIKSNISDKQIINQINLLKGSGEVLNIKEHMLTTKAARDLERANLALIEANKNSTFPLLPLVGSFLVKHLVKDEFKTAPLATLLSAKDRFIGVESSNEKELRSLLKTLCTFTPHCNYYILSKNYNVAKKADEEIGVTKSFSVADFISYTDRLLSDKDNLTKNLSTVWIIYRSEQLTHAQVNSLLKNAKPLGAKIIFTGDTFRTSSIQLSNPFKQLESKLFTVTLKERDKTAMGLLKDARIEEAIQNLQLSGQIEYIENPRQRLNEACAYIATKSGSLLLVQNKALQDSATSLIRDLKSENGSLSGSAYSAQTLYPITLSEQEKSIILSYNVGDVIRFNATIQNTDFKRGLYYNITNINEKLNTISLVDAASNTSKLNFSAAIGSKISSFREKQLLIQAGEHIIWNDHTPNKINSNKFHKGDSFTVLKIDDSGVLTLKGKHDIMTFNMKEAGNQHFDYNYVCSINSLQIEQGLSGAVFIDDKIFPRVSARDLYVAIQSLEGNPKIYAPEKMSFTESLQLDNQINKDNIEHATTSYEPASIKKQDYSANAAVDYAIAKLAEREAVFKKSELEFIAYSYDIKTPIKEIDHSIKSLEQGGTLVAVDEGKYIFKEIYDCELECLNIQDRGINKLQPIVANDNQSLKYIHENTKLTIGQKEAIITCMTSTDRITLIQGVAGSGKTTMLKEVKYLARDNGHEIIGLANTASAKLNLHLKSFDDTFNSDDPRTFAASGIQSQTLAGFLSSSSRLLETNSTLAKSVFSSNTIVVLDEASLVSARNMYSLLKIAENLDLRLIIIGDDRQLPPIEASRAFSLMLGASNNVVNMNVNTRLKTPEALEVMQLIYGANLNPNLIDDAFNKLQQNIVEIPNKQERLKLMADYFTATSPDKRHNILPMMPENKDRVDFNNFVRNSLKQKGELSGIEIKTSIMVAKDLTVTEKNYALSFEIGDFIRFNTAIDRLGIKSGDYFQVISTDREKMILRNDAGDITSWNPFRHSKGNIEVYRQETRGIMVGDDIRWRKNFEDKGIINSETAKILNINDTEITVKLQNDTEYALNINKRNNQHFDHAYGSTVYVAQGLDKINPIGLVDGPKPFRVDIEAVPQGSIIVIPSKNKEVSKVGQVIGTTMSDDNTIITAIDREGKQHVINDKHVDVYPDFNQAKHLPLSNLCNFLVQATRGDDFIVFVDNVEGYKASLKYSLSHLKKTALEMVDVQKGEQIKSKVAKMTSQVFGIAKPEELKNRLLNISHTSIDSTVKKLDLNFYGKRLNFKQDLFHTALNNLKQKLNRDPLAFASQILGPPVTKTPTYANFAMGKDRTKGNLTLDITGSRAGLWCDHRTGEGGDLVTLYAKEYNLGYVEAAKKLFIERNIKELPPSILSKTSLISQKQQNNSYEQLRIKNINQAIKLYNAGRPIIGTLAEKYLSQTRGIKSGIPTDFKFVARCWHKDLRTQKPALLIPAYDENGKLQSVNRIYLGNDAKKLNAFVQSPTNSTVQATQKAVLGPSSGATVCINKVENSRTTYLTEGVENGLSIRQIISDANISSCFGICQLKNINIDRATKTVIICADNDGANLSTKKALAQAVTNFLTKGLEVKLALPISRDIVTKYDYNQMLTDNGLRSISASLGQAVLIRSVSDLGEANVPLYKSYSRLYEQQFGKEIGFAADPKTVERGL